MSLGIPEPCTWEWYKALGSTLTTLICSAYQQLLRATCCCGDSVGLRSCRATGRCLAAAAAAAAHQRSHHPVQQRLPLPSPLRSQRRRRPQEPTEREAGETCVRIKYHAPHLTHGRQAAGRSQEPGHFERHVQLVQPT